MSQVFFDSTDVTYDYSDVTGLPTRLLSSTRDVGDASTPAFTCALEYLHQGVFVQQERVAFTAADSALRRLVGAAYKYKYDNSFR